MSVAIARKPIRAKVCKCGCGEKFIPSRQIQPTRDNFDCKVRYAEKVAAKSRAAREQKERQEHRARKIAAKPLMWHINKAKNAVHAYIRERDKNEPCISCGRWHDGQWHAGHFNSVGSHPEIRFEYDNIHKQCQPCNAHKAGNRAGYEPRLIAKIGQERVDWLNGPHPAAHYTREQLQAIEAKAKADLRALLAKEKVAA